MAIDPALAYATASYSSRSNTSTSAPAGVSAGDFLLFFLYIESTTTVTVPTGATLIDYVDNAGSQTSRIYLARKVATGSDSYAWGHSSAATAAWCKRFTGVDATTPMDCAISKIATAFTNSITATGITTVTDGALVGMCAANYSQALISSSTMTERIDAQSAGLTADIQATAGASGNKTITFSGSGDSEGILFALRPASSGTTYYQSCAGSMPAGSGAITTKVTYGQAVAGDMPAAQGELIKKIFKSLSGNFPSQAGALVKLTSISLSGDMPAPSGQAVKKTSISLSGDMPSASGTVAGALTNLAQAVFGNFPAPTGALVKKIGKGISGTMGVITGSLTKKTGKGISGAMPAAAGDLSAAWNTSQATAGDMPGPTGSLSTLLNPATAARALMKIIGSAFKKLIG